MIIQHKNTNVHFTKKGKGKTVVFLHGFLENLSMWDNLAKELERDHCVVAIDLLGHGKTDCLGYVHTMEDMAAAVNTVFEELNISVADFIGHSMGGYVALAFAEKFPDKVSGICLLNSTSQSDSKARQDNRDRAIQAVKQNHRAFVSMAISNLFAEKNRVKLKTQIEKTKQEALKTPLQGIVAALEGMKIRNDRTAVFKSLSCKKLVVYGEMDTILNAKSLVELFKKRDVALCGFPDGHMSHIENKEELSYILLRFIEKQNI